MPERPDLDAADAAGRISALARGLAALAEIAGPSAFADAGRLFPLIALAADTIEAEAGEISEQLERLSK